MSMAHVLAVYTTSYGRMHASSRTAAARGCCTSHHQHLAGSMTLTACVARPQSLRGADGMGGAALAPTLLALLPSLLRLQVGACFLVAAVHGGPAARALRRRSPCAGRLAHGMGATPNG